jgi:hypothetical protein
MICQYQELTRFQAACANNRAGSLPTVAPSEGGNRQRPLTLSRQHQFALAQQNRTRARASEECCAGGGPGRAACPP